MAKSFAEGPFKKLDLYEGSLAFVSFSMADESAKRARFDTGDGADAGAASDEEIFFPLAGMSTKQRMGKRHPALCVNYRPR